MQKTIVILFTILISKISIGQVFMCKDGNTKFTSEAPLELIKAQSNKAFCGLDIKTKSIAFSIVVESFDGFNGGFQKEHFCENYMETDKYKAATFKGKIIEDIDLNINS